MTYCIAMARVAREPGPRERMIVSAALLIRERGARATSLDAVLAHSGAPRGSLYHHFPGGREQLVREAVEYAGGYVARRMARDPSADPLAAIERLFDEYSAALVASDYRAGCPVVAVAVESPEDGPDLRDSARAAFQGWQTVLMARFDQAGIDAERARDLAMVVLAAFEGALVLSRAYRDLAPLEAARRAIREQVDAELDKRGTR